MIGCICDCVCVNRNVSGQWNEITNSPRQPGRLFPRLCMIKILKPRCFRWHCARRVINSYNLMGCSWTSALRMHAYSKSISWWWNTQDRRKKTVALRYSDTVALKYVGAMTSESSGSQPEKEILSGEQTGQMNPWGGIKKVLFVYTQGLPGVLSMHCVADGAHTRSYGSAVPSWRTMCMAHP
jgi:hypothetical protein